MSVWSVFSWLLQVMQFLQNKVGGCVCVYVLSIGDS